MFKRYIKNNKGSTLLMTLMAMTVLTILGTAIIAISVVNFKMRIREVNSKDSLYKADSKYEEIYSVIVRTIEDARNHANQTTQNAAAMVISRERNREAADIENEISDIINGIDGLGSVNDTALVEHLNEEVFQPEFKNYINTHLRDEINNSEITDGTNLNSLVTTTISNFMIFKSSPNNDPLQFEILYESDHKGVDRSIRGKYSIKVMEYQKDLEVHNEIVPLRENVLWTKAITADGSLLVNCDQATIDGDVYAYGNNSIPEKRGVRVLRSGFDTELTINGSVITNQMIATNTNGSNILINTGDVYCNSIVIPDGIDNASINVEDGSVNTYDDIELNGTNSSINIEGTYYGFSDGSGANEYDMSSAIIINSPDINQDSGSSISITGTFNALTSENKLDHLSILDYANEDDEDIDREGVFIFGTMYVNIIGHNKYQSGESIAVKGNYSAYSRKLKDPSLVADTRGGEFDPDNIILGSYPPLVLVENYKDSEGLIENPDVFYKGSYFEYYDTDYSGNLNTGYQDTSDTSINSIYIQNIKHTLGSFVNKHQVSSAVISPLDELDVFRVKKDRDYKFLVNNLGDKGMMDSLMHNDTINSALSNTLNTKVEVSDRYDQNRFYVDVDGDEVIVINSDSNKTVYIYSPGHRPSACKNSDIAIELENIEMGMVVTDGDIVFNGSVAYNGALAATGDVIINGDSHTISNSYYDDFEFKNSFIQLIAENQEVIDAFDHSNNRGAEIYFSREERVSDNDEIISYRRPQDIIDVKWNRVR